MPRFFFHVHDGVSEMDKVGTEFSDWREARLEAIRLAGEIMQEDAKRIALGHDWRIEVTDDTGLTLFQIAFMIIEAPILRDDLGRSSSPEKRS